VRVVRLLGGYVSPDVDPRLATGYRSEHRVREAPPDHRRRCEVLLSYEALLASLAAVSSFAR
jgi:hypothetical protein